MSSSSPSASVPVPQPLPPAFVAALQAAFSSGSILTSREDLIPYGFDGTAALKQLPQTIPTLVQSNMTLQTAVRLRNLLSLDGRGQSHLAAEDNAALRREVAQHLEEVSRLVAALQPLLATAGTPREGNAR